MKQIIVMVATIVLGIAIGAMVLNFQDSAESITDNAKDRLVTLMNEDFKN